MRALTSVASPTALGKLTAPFLSVKRRACAIVSPFPHPRFRYIIRMKKVTIWHNPRCSKSRETLKLLQDNNIDPEVVEYLKAPPSEQQIRDVLKLLALEPRKFMRTAESVYQEHRLDDPTLSDAELIAAMHRNPILIQRPVVIANGQARIGRPPDAVLEIL